MYQHNSGLRYILTSSVVILFLIDVLSAKCSDGFFNTASGCHKCPQHCKFCNSTDYCFFCEEGFSGINCQLHCKNCKPHTECVQDNGFCVGGCKDGFSGRHCDNVCDSRCKSCDRDNALHCVTCKNNQTCKLTCPCLRHICNGKYCSEGCFEGYWGNSCEDKCLARCISGACYRENGTCFEAKDAKSRLSVSEILLPVFSVFLVIMTCGIVYILFRQRRLRARGKDILQQDRDDRRDAPVNTEYSEGYALPSEPYNAQSLENNESSYLSPTYSTDGQKYEGLPRRHEYIPLSTTTQSENQYQPMTETDSQVLMPRDDQYERPES